MDADSVDDAVVVYPGTILTFRYVVSNFGNVQIKWESLQDDSVPIPCSSLPMTIDPNQFGYCEIEREAVDSPDGTKNIGKACVEDLGEKTDEAWYKTPGEADYCTHSQGGWGAKPAGNNGGELLKVCFDKVYPEEYYPEGVEVGIPGEAGFSMTFTSAEAIEAYLPAGGPKGALEHDYVDPTEDNSSGVFGGQVLALQLNVDFMSRRIDTEGGCSMPGNNLGDLILCNYTPNPDLNGKTVAEILVMANDVLGGGELPAGVSISDLNDLVDALNNSYDECHKSEWAEMYLCGAP